MIKPCIICDASVIVVGDPEIVCCSNDSCLRTVENHITLHYQSENIVLSRNHYHRNDFYLDIFGNQRNEL